MDLVVPNTKGEKYITVSVLSLRKPVKDLDWAHKVRPNASGPASLLLFAGKHGGMLLQALPLQQ